jgi:hypothetical protein
MNADTRLQIEKFKVEYGSAESEKNRQFEAWKLQTGQQFEGALVEFENEYDRQIEALKHAGDKDINLDSLKGNMAQTAMKLRTQIRLAGANGKAEQVATPAIEPVGTAPAGQSFQR